MNSENFHKAGVGDPSYTEKFYNQNSTYLKEFVS